MTPGLRAELEGLNLKLGQRGERVLGFAHQVRCFEASVWPVGTRTVSTCATKVDVTVP